MHTEKRRFEPGVIERLFAEPHRFEYFQAVRMLELWLKRNGVPHEGAVANFLRFQNSVSLNFPASQIEALQPEPRNVARDARSLGEALRRAELKYIRVTPAFMGMLGMTGSLPAHYTERIAAQQLYDKDDGPRAFLDTFSNRALALFYEAWRKYRLELKYQIGGKDLFLPLLLALAGVGHTSLQQRTRRRRPAGRVARLFLRRACCIGRPRPGRSRACCPNTSASRSAWSNSSASGMPCRWLSRARWAACNAVLGASAVVGARAWQRDLRLRLTVGPLDRASVRRLPAGRQGGARAGEIADHVHGADAGVRNRTGAARRRCRGHQPRLGAQRRPARMGLLSGRQRRRA